ncbi:decapping and exoribonuclease protein [Neovison vison]|uniref:Decapping nuclease n=1 Tax=Neovison vison TaxID=452646 RepID=A0A8C7BD42_NEOVI|nr:decapping and exoribonuclease protein [Neogale vison]XP_044111984.1 decapping and exoribonuclease protein [Neogale vison]XP_044111992.1 decapping and exoribonuclease protein [Neogale vison]
MDRRENKRKLENVEVECEPRNKLTSPASSLPTDPALYTGPFPFYGRPSELGCFSLDAQRQYHGDAQALRYYSPPPTNDQGPNFDLRDGYPDRYQPRDEELQEGLDHLLHWLLDHRGKLEGGPGWLAGAIVTWRGHLTKLLTTPYEQQEGWQLAASRFQGTLYLSEVETPAARAQRLARPPLLRELMYMGYKFEQYMCADKPGSFPDPSGEVNTNVAFCSVLRSRLGNHRLLFSGEVDCMDPRAPCTQPPACYVELKTSKEMHRPGHWRNFYRHKLLKWWAQSFLLGVPNVVAGFRNPEGFVCSLKTFPTMEMFEYVRNDRDGWNPSVCMNFCAAFLSFAQNTVVQDDPRLVYLFSWEPGSPVTVSKYQDAPYAFLPTWYVEAVTRDLPSAPKTPSPKD